jgi:hypothetical protein
VGDTGFEPVTSFVSGQKALVGNAGDCCVWSVSRVAYVCHCAGWLADRLWFRHKPSCREKAWVVPRGRLRPRISRHERAAVMLVPFRRWAPRSASRLARSFPRCSRAPRSARPIPQVRLGLAHPQACKATTIGRSEAGRGPRSGWSQRPQRLVYRCHLGGDSGVDGEVVQSVSGVCRRPPSSTPAARTRSQRRPGPRRVAHLPR